MKTRKTTGNQPMESRRAPRIRVDELELQFFPNTPEPDLFWGDLYNPPQPIKERRRRK